MSSYASAPSSSTVPARCRSNAVSIQRPLSSAAAAASSPRGVPKLTLQIPAQRAPTRPILRVSCSISPPPSHSHSHSPPTPTSTSSSSPTSSSPSSAPSPPPELSPQDVRTQRAKLVAGILLSRHTGPRPVCPWGALRSTCGTRSYVRTPLRAEVC